MCAIVGIHTQKKNVCLGLYNALTVLQHRGQDAAGMSTCDNTGYLKIHKKNGLVRDVFTNDEMENLMGGTYGIGHARYPTAGVINHNEAQPFYVNSPFGIVLVHNGNLVNAEKLRSEIQNKHKRHINSTSDSEILLNVFADCLSNECRKQEDLNDKKIIQAVNNLHDRVEGAYSVAILIVGYGKSIEIFKNNCIALICEFLLPLLLYNVTY